MESCACDVIIDDFLKKIGRKADRRSNLRMIYVIHVCHERLPVLLF